jgi:hypothetical protein
VLRYLRGITSHEIHYLGYPLALKGYSDSNWISNEDETKATNGYMFTLAGAVISWRSCKQVVLTKLKVRDLDMKHTSPSRQTQRFKLVVRARIPRI